MVNCYIEQDYLTILGVVINFEKFYQKMFKGDLPVFMFEVV